MIIRKYISRVAMLCAIALTISACSEEKLDPNSIFGNEDTELDPNSASYKFDKWLQINYLTPYNLQFGYKMQDVGTDMDYNLVPATYEKSIDLAVLTKYLWFDVYSKIVSDDFLKFYGPRMIHLIGSPAYNPANHTMILGLAEGGLKVSLFRVNSIDPSDFGKLNEYYFKTMHHEFAHILHQTKTYPKEFNTLSSRFYDPFQWQDRPYVIVASLGFTSPYASSQNREDFAETIANYITMTEDQWNELLHVASKNWEEIVGNKTKDYYCYYYYTDNIKENPKIGALESEVKELEARGITVYEPVSDGIDGKEIILQKVSIAREWFKDAWSIDIDALRAEVQIRQTNFDIEKLREEVNQTK